MTNTKLDFEAAREWAEDTSGLHSFRTLNLAACYLALLQKTEKLKAALEGLLDIEGLDSMSRKTDTLAIKNAILVLKEFEEIEP